MLLEGGFAGCFSFGTVEAKVPTMKTPRTSRTCTQRLVDRCSSIISSWPASEPSEGLQNGRKFAFVLYIGGEWAQKLPQKAKKFSGERRGGTPSENTLSLAADLKVVKFRAKNSMLPFTSPLAH